MIMWIQSTSLHHTSHTCVQIQSHLRMSLILYMEVKYYSAMRRGNLISGLYSGTTRTKKGNDSYGNGMDIWT